MTPASSRRLPKKPRSGSAMLSGAWRTAEIVDEMTSRNYWFGLSTGVVAVHAPKLPYQTKKLLEFSAANPEIRPLEWSSLTLPGGGGRTATIVLEWQS